MPDPVNPNEALQQMPQNTGMERPSWLPQGDVTGTEHIGKDDIQMPRLVLAQKMSPEVDDADAKRIDGLKPGDIFNGLTKAILGRGPLPFHVIRADRPRFVEFFPREDGGGVKDPNVPPDDPRTEFGKDGSKPQATKFYDFIIYRPDTKELVALSFKSTGLKVAKQLNALIKLRNAPVYAGRFNLMSVDTQNSKGKFAIFHVANAGWASSPEELQELKDFYEALATKEINIQREDRDDEDLEFPPVPSEAVAGDGKI